MNLTPEIDLMKKIKIDILATEIDMRMKIRDVMDQERRDPDMMTTLNKSDHLEMITMTEIDKIMIIEEISNQLKMK